MRFGEQAILDFLSRPGYRPVKAKVLAKKLGVTKKTQTAFFEVLDGLIESGQVRRNSAGLLRAKAAPGLIAGVVKRISSGAGFLIPHDAPPEKGTADIYIAAEDMGDAHSGDEVLVRLLGRGRQGRPTGRIEDVIQRATSTFVGTYFERAGRGFVQVDGNTFQAPIAVGDPGAKGAQPDDKVVIDMLRFPSQVLEGEAVLTKVLGPRGEPGIDLLSIVHEFGLPQEFPEDALEEARIQADQFDESDLQGRLDLTRETIVTIDPKDARDFDDAISLEKRDNGHWLLGVHIADVAHFVPEGSALDLEARQRATSIYLPGKVIPMLPELLSNGLASLQQGRVRFVKSVFMEFSAEGTPLSTRFANSAIKVTRRFAYEEVLPIVREPERFRTRVGAKVRVLLARMHEFAMLLRARRFAAGALEMSIPEVELEFDKAGRVTGAHEESHDESHQIIEEFMLAANIAVATELADRGIPLMRRVHGEPELIKLRAFADFVGVLGYPLTRFQSRPDLQALLLKVQGEPVERAVNFALLRSMKRAEYTGIEQGHYALAEPNYCHFTSPIRRYPDLTVHRLVDALASGRKRPKGPSEIDLVKLGKQCSALERRADEAERELTRVKLLTYMADRIGDELEAIITGVERFGIFCQGIQIPAEGLVHISSFADDYYDYDATAFSIIGRRSGQQFRLGDVVRVKVVHVDVDRRELDYRIVGVVRQAPKPAGRAGGGGRARGRSNGRDGAKRGRRSSRPKRR